MNKMRENTGVVLWILVFAFGVLWVLQDSGGLDYVGNRASSNIAEVNGDVVTFEEYSRALDAQLQQYQAQTGEPMPPQMVDLTRDRVFNALVEDRLLEQEMERLGITVSDDEVYQMVLGENPHPIIQAYFGDGQGGVNRTLLQNFAQDPEAREEWIQLEDYLRSERRREKLANLVGATARVTEQDIIDEYQRRNRTANAQYVALRYAAIPDDSITVTERDLRAYYEEHREDYERPRTVTINYVSLSKEPTPQDTALIVNELQQLKPRFAQAEDDSLFLVRNASERPYSSQFFRADELDAAVANAVFPNPQPGQVIGPLVAGTEAHLVKVKDVQPAEQAAVRARHILFRAPEGDEAARAQARQEAQQVLQRIRGGADFAQVAREVSDDPSGAQGGDLGWFGPGRMVEPFEEAAMSAPVNQVVGPVETQFGVHLIQVVARADQEVQLADYAVAIRPDVATLNAIQEKLDDLQYYASESGDFQAEAERLGLNVQTVEAEADQQFIPGIGNSRALMNFMAEAEEGDVSRVIELNDQFIVAEAAEIQEAGVRPFDNVRAELEPRVRLQKKREMQVARLKQALQQGGFEGLAQRVGASVQTAAGLSFSNPVVAGLGREPKLVGTALGLGEGQTSGAVEGESAAYVVRTTQINEPAPLAEQMKEQIRQQLLNQRRQIIMGQWLASLREQAEVEDHRRLFEQ